MRLFTRSTVCEILIFRAIVYIFLLSSASRARLVFPKE